MSEADAVLERALIEHAGGPLSQGGVHTILDREANGLDGIRLREVDEALEEGLTKARLGGRLAHNDRAELTMVTDKNDLFSTEDQRDKDFRFRGLSCLVNEHLPELET